jgi:hypothetical protein
VLNAERSLNVKRLEGLTSEDRRKRGRVRRGNIGGRTGEKPEK